MKVFFCLVWRGPVKRYVVVAKNAAEVRRTLNCRKSDMTYHWCWLENFGKLAEGKLSYVELTS